MSGPVTTADAPAQPAADAASICDLEVIDGRDAEVGGFDVRRLLPRRKRRTVGAWCFVDVMGPSTVTDGRGLNIGPHPHIGLQTVTWLLRGGMLHRDSMGSEQVIRPGELNLMTAGHGVSHSEETAGVYEGELHGVQLWVAQPSGTRDGGPAFEHHPELPRLAIGAGAATVLVGDFLGMSSPARRDSDHVGVALELGGGRTDVPLDANFEYAVVALETTIAVAGRELAPGAIGYLGVGRNETALEVLDAARVLLIGGRPFEEPLLMWWNYVARSRDEVTDAHRAWLTGDGRFGDVASPLEPMPAPDLPWG